MTFGHGLIFLSLLTTLGGMAFYAIGRTRVARFFVIASAVSLVAALALLWTFILTHRFEYSYVFRYSSLDMPFKYVVASLWGGQEGTFLMWAVYGGLLSVFLMKKAYQYESAVNFFYMGITAFLLLMLVKASPFAKLDGIPLDGRGLNPLLQDPWMTIHPPIMFFGFASLGIPAAFAMAALVREDWDEWVPRAMPWTLLGVMALGTGLTLGGYWAYSILGWGGFWGWDPVENSSLVPWLFGITLLHTQMIQMRRGLFRRINLLLSLLPFLFLTYSTFLTRSGVLADFSVHSFTNLGINTFLAAFMAVFFFTGVGLLAFKFKRIPVENVQAPLLSRDYFMFLGALSFGLFGVFVCLGTSAPLLTQLWGPPGNVEPEFYNRIGLPFIILVGLLMSLGPHLTWTRSISVQKLASSLWPAVVGTFVVVLLAFLWGVHYWPYLLMICTGVFTLLANTLIVRRLIVRKPEMAGGYIAHVGVGFMVLGILFSTTQGRMELLELPKDSPVEALGYTFEYTGSRSVEAGRKNAYDVQVTKGDGLWTLSPVMYFSEFNAGMMKKPAIKARLTHDIYVAPGGYMVETVADRTKRFLTLHKKQPQTLGDMVFYFDRFETSGEEAHGDDMAIAALIDVTVYGNTERVTPGVVTDAEGNMQMAPVRLEHSGMLLTLDGIDATNGAIRLGVQDPPIHLAVGESTEVQGIGIQLQSFDVDMGTNRGTKISIYTNVLVTMGGDVLQVKPGLIHRANMDPSYEEVSLGDTGLNLVLASVNATERTADFYLTRPPREAIWVEASVKPFIQLLWIGTAFVVLGIGVAAVYRGKLVAKLSRKVGSTPMAALFSRKGRKAA